MDLRLQQAISLSLASGLTVLTPLSLERKDRTDAERDKSKSREPAARDDSAPNKRAQNKSRTAS